MNPDRKCIAVTGAAGFIGRHLVGELSDRQDVDIRLLFHSNAIENMMKKENIIVFEGDLLKPESLSGFLKPGCTVINLANLRNASEKDNLEAMTNLAVACRSAQIKKLVHCSTAAVSGRVSTDRVTENTIDNPLNEYEVTKSKIEKLLIEKSDGFFETVILRPTAVFGKGGKNLVKLADSLICGNQFVNYLKSCLYQFRRMNLVYIDNVVSAIEFCIRTDRNVNGETFIISDDEDLSNNYRDIETYLMKRMGCKAYLIAPVSLPFPILRSLLRLAGRSNDNPDLVYDCGKILSSGFKKPLSFKDGLSLFSDWYIKTPYLDNHHT